MGHDLTSRFRDWMHYWGEERLSAFSEKCELLVATTAAKQAAVDFVLPFEADAVRKVSWGLPPVGLYLPITILIGIWTLCLAVFRVRYPGFVTPLEVWSTLFALALIWLRMGTYLILSLPPKITKVARRYWGYVVVYLVFALLLRNLRPITVSLVIGLAGLLLVSLAIRIYLTHSYRKRVEGLIYIERHRYAKPQFRFASDVFFNRDRVAKILAESVPSESPSDFLADLRNKLRPVINKDSTLPLRDADIHRLLSASGKSLDPQRGSAVLSEADVGAAQFSGEEAKLSRQFSLSEILCVANPETRLGQTRAFEILRLELEAQGRKPSSLVPKVLAVIVLDFAIIGMMIVALYSKQLPFNQVAKLILVAFVIRELLRHFGARLVDNSYRRFWIVYILLLFVLIVAMIGSNFMPQSVQLPFTYGALLMFALAVAAMGLMALLNPQFRQHASLARAAQVGRSKNEQAIIFERVFRNMTKLIEFNRKYPTYENPDTYLARVLSNLQLGTETVRPKVGQRLRQWAQESLQR